jgi:hypothetical protein
LIFDFLSRFLFEHFCKDH